ncbi:hypothetical protein [Aeromonas enteropelogenes]|uniref:hypothetical protein n=1 Tax=Aeromonas enteropelogenes TaxID=29489 RepID=UPI003BA24CDE
MYRLSSGSGVIRISDGAFIPDDKSNRDYREYLIWLNDGNTPEPGEVSAPPSRDDIEKFRLHAYADPLTGSDRHFNEAIRMQVMGEEGWDVVRQRGITRFEEIQLQYPWPV